MSTLESSSSQAAEFDMMYFLKKLNMGLPKSVVVGLAAASGISAIQLEQALADAAASKHEAKGREDYPLSHIFGVEGCAKEFNDNLSFDTLISRSNALPYEFPLYNNKLQVLCGNNEERKEAVLAHARGTRPLLHSSIWSLCDKFLVLKRVYGSKVEKELYENMSVEELVQRLLVKRPLAFLTSSDSYLLKTGPSGAGRGFDSIGTDHESLPLLISELLSYHEMQLSSLIAVSTPTHFINSGSRGNCGKIGNPGTYEPSGVYVAQVGARFERNERMESEYCYVGPSQNTVENGYGAADTGDAPICARRERLKMWAEFFGVGHLPLYSEAASNVSKEFLPSSSDADAVIPRYVPTGGGFLDTLVYQRRMKLSVETFLAEANDRGGKSGKGAYCHVVGLGLGVWQIHPIQALILVRCYRDTLCENHYPHITDLCFGWFDEKYCDQVFHVKNGDAFQVNEKETVNILFSKRDPLEKLDNENQGKLLVAQYAWDGNSWPGNEYWMGSLSASGDPAAACCSTIQELQNPDVNCEYVSGSNAHVVSHHTSKDETVGGGRVSVSVVHHSQCDTFDMRSLQNALGAAAE
jgi:hypothetical protein